MAMLWVKESGLLLFNSRINGYSSALDDVSSMYAGAERAVSAYTGDSNVRTCNTYLEKRRRDLESRAGAAEQLKQRVIRYVNGVIEADSGAADIISTQSYSFYEKKGLIKKPESLGSRAWNGFKTSVRDFCADPFGTLQNAYEGAKKAVLDFYEEYKVIIDIGVEIVTDVLAVTAAVALFTVSGGSAIGVICTLGAMWATAKAGYELTTDCVAAAMWISGDEEGAKLASQRTLTGDMVSGAQWLDGTLGVQFFQPFTKALCVELEACQCVANVVVVWESFREIFNLKVRSDGRPLNSLNPSVKMSWNNRRFGFAALNPMGTQGNGARFASATNWKKFIAWELGFKFKKDAKTDLEFVGSLLDNRKKNEEKLKSILKNPDLILPALPGVSQGIDFWNASAEILAM